MRNEGVTRIEARDIAAKVVAPTDAMARNTRGALLNYAQVDQNPTVHLAGQATITAFAGMLLTARGSGRFMVAMSAMAAAAAGDVVTWTVDVYTDSVVGTPLTLPANAHGVGTNCYVDNSGAGIVPSAGATVAAVVTAPSHTIGTTAVDDIFTWSNIVGAGGSGAILRGMSFYVTLSITDSVAARAITQVTLSAFELPA